MVKSNNVNKSKKKHLNWIAGTVAVLVLAGSGVTYHFTAQDKYQPIHFDKENGKGFIGKNIINQSLYTGNGKYEVERGAEGFLSVKDDETGKVTKIDGDPRYINADNNGIYYEDASRGDELMKVSYSDKKAKVLVNDQVTNVLSSDGQIYYSSYTKGNQIFKVGERGGKPNLVVKDGSISFFIKGQSLYYASEKGGLYKAGLDGERAKKIADGQFWRISLSGDYIYYIDSPDSVGSLYRVDVTTGKKKLLVDDKLSTYYIYSNKILYSVSDEGKSIGTFLLNLSTMKTKKVSSFNTFNMYEKGNLIYMKQYFDGKMVTFDPKTEKMRSAN